MGQRHTGVYFTVYLLVLVILADLTETISLACNKGMLIMNNERETVFTVIQENCPVQWGTCEDCYDFCSNYTDVIFRIKDVDVNGQFNMSWIINGGDSTYLMQYGLQQYNGVLLMRYTVLHLPATKIPSKGIYSIVVQCQTSAFARIRVTIWLPTGNRTSYVNYAASFVKSTVRVPTKTNDATVLTIKEEAKYSYQSPTKLSAGKLAAIVLGAVVATTIFIVISGVYLRRAAINRQHASDSSLQQVSNNQLPSVTNESAVDQSAGISDPRDTDDPWGDHMDTCPTLPRSQVSHDMPCDQYRPHISAFEKVHNSSNHLCRHDFREREAMHDARTVNLTRVTNVRRKQLGNPVEQNSSFRYIIEDQFPSDIQEQLKSLNLDAEMP